MTRFWGLRRKKGALRAGYEGPEIAAVRSVFCASARLVEGGIPLPRADRPFEASHPAGAGPDFEYGTSRHVAPYKQTRSLTRVVNAHCSAERRVAVRPRPVVRCGEDSCRRRGAPLGAPGESRSSQKTVQSPILPNLPSTTGPEGRPGHGLMRCGPWYIARGRQNGLGSISLSCVTRSVDRLTDGGHGEDLLPGRGAPVCRSLKGWRSYGPTVTWRGGG